MKWFIRKKIMKNPSTRDGAATELPPSAYPRKRAGHLGKRVLLAVILLLVALSGIWFLGVGWRECSIFGSDLRG